MEIDSFSLSVQNISGYDSVKSRVSKIFTISLSLGGKLTGVNLFEATDEELDMFLGYAEEYNKHIAESTNKGKSKKNNLPSYNRNNRFSKIEESKKHFIEHGDEQN